MGVDPPPPIQPLWKYNKSNTEEMNWRKNFIVMWFDIFVRILSLSTFQRKKKTWPPPPLKNLWIGFIQFSHFSFGKVSKTYLRMCFFVKIIFGIQLWHHVCVWFFLIQLFFFILFSFTFPWICKIKDFSRILAVPFADRSRSLRCLILTRNVSFRRRQRLVSERDCHIC